MEVESLSWIDYHQLLSYNNITSHQATQFEYSQPFERNRVSLFIAYSILLLVGLAGNAWVACVIVCVLRACRRSQSSPAIHVYILALCCCDLVVLVSLIFLLLDLAYGRWVIPSNLVCQLYLSSEALNKFCGPFILMSMSGYCYYRVCWPAKAGLSAVNRNSSTTSGNRAVSGATASLIAKEVRRTVAMIVICVLAALVLMVPVYVYGGINYLIVHNKSIVRMVLPKCSMQPPENILTLFTTYTFVLGHMLPALLFTYFYSAILYRVRHRQCYNRSGDSSLHFWRVAKTCMALVLFYLLCWTPYWAMSLYHYLKPFTDSTNHHHQGGIVLSYFIHMLPYVNCTGYPILYTFINRNIKAAYNQAKEDKRRRDRDRKMRRMTHNHLKLTHNGEAASSAGNEISSTGTGSIPVTCLHTGAVRYSARHVENIIYMEGETVL